MNRSKFLRSLALVASVSVLSACGGGGGSGSASRWPFRVTVDQYPQGQARLRAAARASAVAVGDLGRGTNLVFTSDGTPVVGYWVADAEGSPYGDLRAAAITGDSVEKTTLLSSSSHIWSRLAIGAGDALSFYYSPYETETTSFGYGYYQGQLGAGATLTRAQPGDRGFVRAMGVPVRSPSGAIVTPVVSDTGQPTDLSLFTDAWGSPDRVTIESADYGPVRLQWGNNLCVPSLTFDLSGDPVVAYERNDVVYPQEGGVDAVDHIFVVARKSGGVWTSEDVLTVPYDATQNVAEDAGPFVEVDAAGTLHLLTVTEDEAWYATKPVGGAWSHEQVPLDLAEQSIASFTLDGGVPSVLYGSARLGAALARRTGGGWSSESIDPDGGVSEGALAVDPSGALWAVYLKVVGGQVTLMAARRDSERR